MEWYLKNSLRVLGRCFVLGLWLLNFARAGATDTVVVFNEVMYHPGPGDALEWIELYNQMAVDVELSGWSIEGANFRFPTNTVIAGGKFLLVASDPGELARRSGLTNVFGPLGGKLSNSGERLRLLNHNLRVMDEMAFENKEPWPVGADGSGFTLAKRDSVLASDRADSWTVSSQPGGTPGAANFSGALSKPSLLLNEVAASTNFPFWVELMNPGSTAVDLAGFKVQLSGFSAPFMFPNGASVSPGSVFLFETPGYVARAGDNVFLMAADGDVLMDARQIDTSVTARGADATWFFPNTATPGHPNGLPSKRDVVINEIMFKPPAGETNSSWIELLNRETNAVDVSAWKIAGVGFKFPKNTILGPGEFMVVAENAAALRVQYPGVRILGDFGKKLSGSSDQLTLEDERGNRVTSLRYFSDDPWPADAAQGGVSLELRDGRANANAPEAWAASDQPGPWKSYSYTAVASADGGPTRWNEFIFGLLDAGEVLLDDFSVIENPGSSGRELLQNGRFENGTASWRFLGTHRLAEVVLDPEVSTNHVLRLRADGPTEHMHNHVETTLLNNAAIRNGTTYQISWRARWLRGCNSLNTRLYFNRVARTTALERPTAIATPGAPNSRVEANIGPTFSRLQHAPVVPTATQSVTVTIQAEDPDGVRQCRLWSAVNGANWTSTTMSLTNGQYTASVPARPSGTVVQFYVEAEDLAGAVSYYPAAAGNARALYKVNDSQPVSPRLHNFRLIMLPAEANALHATTNVMSNGRSLCTVIYDEREIFYNCGLHLQSSERGRADATRVGFTVNFPADHLFRGTQNTVTFDRSGGWSGRGGRQDEIVMRHIINQAGDSPDMYNDLVRVLTPLSTHSGTAMLLMAKYSSDFFDASVYPHSGSLFKLELVYYPTTSVNNDPQMPKLPQPDDVVGTDISNLGPNPEAYRWFYLAENHADSADYAGLIKVAQSFSLSGAALQQKTSELLDIEQWIRVFAFKSLSGDPDTYGFGLPHNQLIYVPVAGKALTLPWDMDFSWTRSPSETINVSSRVGQIIHGYPANQRLFLGDIRDITETSYNTNYMGRWTAHYGTLAGQNYSGVLSYIGQRAAAARSQLPALANFAITSIPGALFQTNATSIVLRGTAPYSLKRLQFNDGVPGAGFQWTAVQNWEVTVPLSNGTNRVQITGYDFHNQAVATNLALIVSTAGVPDRDHDGMPDDWELRFGLNPDADDSALDLDHDGMSNLAEYRAGTNPGDAASLLGLTIGKAGGQQFDLSFSTQPGKAYHLEYRIGFSGNWSPLLNVAAGEGGLFIQRQTQSAVANAIFYRVRLDP